MIYLASPYTHPNEAIRIRRFILARDFVHSHLCENVILFSPIVYTHQLAMTHQMPVEAQFWKFFNEDILRKADSMWVLKIDGWDESVGVLHEIEFAAKIRLPIEYKEAPKYAYF